jgi:hypothetical protein
MCRAHGTDAVAKLAKLMHRGKTEQIQFAAACALLDRGYGRPPSTLDVTTRVAPETVYSTPQQFREALLARGLPEDFLPPFLRERLQ